jgi:cytoskeletal protein CcmA (bactofilin family)
MHLVSCLQCRTSVREATALAGSTRRANPLSASNGNDRHPKTRTDTLIGAGLRLEGNIACSGVLRIEGEVHGDITCDADAGGTIVVLGSGHVCGTLRAPHIIVAGNVLGPLESAESIEILQGANVAGDILYHAILIHPGGVIQGSLNPGSAEDVQRTGRRAPASAAGAPADATSGSSPRKPPRPLVRIVAAVAFFGVIATVVLLNRNPEPAMPPAAETAGNTAPATGAAPLAATAEAPVRQDGTGTAAASGADASASKPAPEPPPQAPAPGTEKPVVVQGVNPGKPGGVFSVLGKEPAVLIRKMRGDASEGARIEVPPGTAASIPFARNEIFRVVQGRDIEIFYQGRKVGPKTIESGAWMSFVPQPSGAGSRKE